MYGESRTSGTKKGKRQHTSEKNGALCEDLRWPCASVEVIPRSSAVNSGVTSEQEISLKVLLSEGNSGICAMMPEQLKLPKGAKTKIKHARVARLATVDQECRPHVVPICFTYTGGVFYTAVDRKPKRVPGKDLARVRNITTRSSVALVIDQYREDWRQLWYVLVQGKATLVPPSARKERAEAMRQLRAKYAPYAAGMLPDDALIIRIAPQRITVWGEL